MDQVRQRANRTTPLRTEEVIAGLNPFLRGWGEYYKRALVRKLFQGLDGWIRRRIWSHRYRRWRNPGWKRLPATQLCGRVRACSTDLFCILASLSLRESCIRANRTCSLGGGRRPAPYARLLRPDYQKQGPGYLVSSQTKPLKLALMGRCSRRCLDVQGCRFDLTAPKSAAAHSCCCRSPRLWNSCSWLGFPLPQCLSIRATAD
jgi:hypothetical protein